MKDWEIARGYDARSMVPRGGGLVSQLRNGHLIQLCLSTGGQTFRGFTPLM